MKRSTVYDLLGLTFGAILFGMAMTADANPSSAYAYSVPLDMNLDGKSDCTGTVVSDRAILTATHCFEFDGDATVGGKIVKRIDDGSDHTLLVFQEPRFEKWAVVNLRPAQIGETVHIFGNPGFLQGMYRRGYAMGTFPGNASIPPAAMFSLQSFPGDSGSGIFDDQGNLIGVLSFLLGQQQQQTSWNASGAFSLSFTSEQWSYAGVKIK